MLRDLFFSLTDSAHSIFGQTLSKVCLAFVEEAGSIGLLTQYGRLIFQNNSVYINGNNALNFIFRRCIMRSKIDN